MQRTSINPILVLVLLAAMARPSTVDRVVKIVYKPGDASNGAQRLEYSVAYKSFDEAQADLPEYQDPFGLSDYNIDYVPNLVSVEPQSDSKRICVYNLMGLDAKGIAAEIGKIQEGDDGVSDIVFELSSTSLQYGYLRSSAEKIGHFPTLVQIESTESAGTKTTNFALIDVPSRKALEIHYQGIVGGKHLIALSAFDPSKPGSKTSFNYEFKDESGKAEKLRIQNFISPQKPIKGITIENMANVMHSSTVAGFPSQVKVSKSDEGIKTHPPEINLSDENVKKISGELKVTTYVRPLVAKAMAKGTIHKFSGNNEETIKKLISDLGSSTNKDMKLCVTTHEKTDSSAVHSIVISYADARAICRLEWPKAQLVI